MAAMSIQLETRPALPLAVIRRSVPAALLPRVVPECCGLVWQALKAQGLRGGRNVAVYLDSVIRVEAGVELTGPFTEEATIVRSSTPAGLVAWLHHFGPYGTLGRAHDSIHAWCKANRHRPLGPRWEIYGHWQSAWDADPARIETEVVYLVTAC